MTAAFNPAGSLARELTRLVGPRHVRVAASERLTYASDGLPTHRRTPGLVVLPGTRDEVVAVVRALARLKVPFVPRGAGTGLSGGALAAPDAVLLVLTRLNRILEIDARNRRAVVEPGVVNVRLSAAAAPHGLHYAPDPSSQTACTIGGNVAENAGGPHCLKHGTTTQHILALEVVLADGSVVGFGSPGGEGWGPDLVGLFVGSEGNFGVATRITVRLTPTPRAVRTLLADFPSLRNAGAAVSAVIASGVVPAALEMMDRSCVNAVEDSVYAAGYPRDAAAVLLAELDGAVPAAVDADARAVAALLTEHGARTVRSATDPAERERLWQGRKKAFGAMGRLSRDLVVQDAVVPRSILPDVLEQISGIAARYGLVVSNVFHAGDGNLHPNISFDATDAALKARVEIASAEIMAACIAAGGTITGEHGVGLDKLRYMPLVFDGDALAAM
ncbi:MAG TPA: FAD-linked oxidase C-terminal domain-containing protein, partial [Gemmatimonadales bacterium]